MNPPKAPDTNPVATFSAPPPAPVIASIVGSILGTIKGVTAPVAALRPVSTAILTVELS